MRTIKFRGFNKKNGQWLYGYYLQNRGAHFVCPDEFANGKSWDDYEVDPETVGQFTGLLDKSGKEIYENNLVKTQWSGRVFGVVTWHDYGYFFIDTTNGEWKRWGNGFRPLGEMMEVSIDDVKVQIEVIGNIHDNPELLNEKQ